MRATLRKTTNSRARRRARCHKPKDEREKVAALVPTPTLPDLYAFEEIQTPEPLIALDARQLPSIEPEPVVLPRTQDGLRAALPNKSTLQRVRDARGDWTFRLGLRWTWPGKYPGLPWIPQIVRRGFKHDPLPDRSELPEPIDAEQVRTANRVGFARAIREVRDERYLDASQLAKDAEMPLWQLTALEEARLTPIPYTLVLRLARALNMKAAELVERAEEFEGEVEER
jgi:hypothetical protein